jgi:hypothetical protein
LAALTPIYIGRYGGGYGLRYKWIIVSAASQNDTVTVSELDTITDTVAVQMDTGAEVTCSEATNVVTVAGALTSKDLMILVSGH